MRYQDLLTEKWSEERPLENTPDPLDWWDQRYVKMLQRYHEVKDAPRITREDAEMLIAANESLAETIFDYKYANAPIAGEAARTLIDIISRIEPVDKTFYRGVETENYDASHIMPVQSWSANIKTAKMFGRYIFQTIGPVQGFEIANVYYWFDSLYGGMNGLGDSQAEWLLLNPRKAPFEE